MKAAGLPISFCIMAAIALGQPQAARAAIIQIDDTVESQLSILANDFEDHVDVNGGFFQSGLFNPAMTTLPGEGVVTFNGSWIDLGLTPTGSRTIYIMDYYDPSMVSAIWQASFSSDGISFGTISATYESSSYAPGMNLGSLPGGVDPGDVFVEGGPILFADLPYLAIPILTTPEPGSALLILMGMAGLVARRRR